MPKYNPKNKQHRKTLATRITKMLVAAGYKLDKQARSAEDVYRLDLTGVKKGTAYVRVSTSISKGEVGQLIESRNSEMLKGMVKAANKAIITVFWFHDGQTQQVSPLDIAPLSVAA